MRRIMLAMALLLCSWTWASAATMNAGLNDVIAAVEKAFQQDNSGHAPISDFTADFFQRTQLSTDRREMRGDGRVSVRMPSDGQPLMFRFEYYRPARQEIVSDGRSMWIYLPENRQVILSDVSFLYDRRSLSPNNDPSVNFLQGLGRISKDFQINFAPGMYDAAGNYVLELNPRRSMLNTRRILLVVDRDSVVARTAAKGSTPTAPPTNRPGSPAAKTGPLAPLGAFGVPQSNLFPVLSSTVEGHDGTIVTMEFSNIRINNRIPRTEFNFIIPADAQVVRPSDKNLPR
ncbi:LolA family protein [Pelotalea chapellei]|uniref:Outer membrane lipoprotein carrier protein LolA n=1 Tax=Pelotalea chapellei TaxID=44671 RepID=A0ABS5U9A6_9BACT|nr:outer membrane lipoprotein carrier protein LolA [Pelotalea chapellei]MBT1072272.1 outer membrane lipoprotein carrier protein LolA [Pelotalea chapellei]